MEHWIFNCVVAIFFFLILCTKLKYICTDRVKLKISSVLSTNKFDIMELLDNLFINRIYFHVMCNFSFVISISDGVVDCKFVEILLSCLDFK